MKIHIADDHPMIIEGFTSLIKKDSSLNEITSSLSGKSLLKWLSCNEPDMLILDISMPDIDGLEILKTLNESKELPKTIIVSSYTQFPIVQDALCSGAKGFVSKIEAGECILDAIKKVSQGGNFLSQNVKNSLVDRHFELINNDSVFLGEILKKFLSKKELSVAKLVSKSFTTKEIAEELKINENTVRTYTNRIRNKFNIKSNIITGILFGFLKSK